MVDLLMNKLWLEVDWLMINLLMIDWWLIDDLLMICWWFVDDLLMIYWWLIDDWFMINGMAISQLGRLVYFYAGPLWSFLPMRTGTLTTSSPLPSWLSRPSLPPRRSSWVLLKFTTTSQKPIQSTRSPRLTSATASHPKGVIVSLFIPLLVLGHIHFVNYKYFNKLGQSPR